MTDVCSKTYTILTLTEHRSDSFFVSDDLTRYKLNSPLGKTTFVRTHISIFPLNIFHRDCVIINAVNSMHLRVFYMP